MSDEPKCPHCMAPVSVTDTAGNPWFACGSTKTFRSASCIDREPLAIELRAAKERVKRLEEAGDMLRNDLKLHWDETRSMNAWEQAKEAKP